MDVLMGCLVVLVGAIGVAAVAMACWTGVRALADSRFMTAGLIALALGMGGYFGRESFVLMRQRFAATDYTIDSSGDPRVMLAEWNSDIRRLPGRRRASLITRGGLQITMPVRFIEMRKSGDRLRSAWLQGEVMSLDDALEVAERACSKLHVQSDATLAAWASRNRNTFDRNAPGWAGESNPGLRPYSKVTIDTDGMGFWWVGVFYAW